MKKSFTLLFKVLALLLLPLISSAADFSIRGDYNQTTKSMDPDFALSWNWDENFTSAVDGIYSKTVTIAKLDNFAESNIATESKQWYGRINYLCYNIHLTELTGFIGLTGEFDSIKNKDFGYFQLDSINYGAYNSAWVNFENNVSITAYVPFLTTGFRFINPVIFTVLRFDYYPAYYLKVKQNTVFHPIISEPGTTENSCFKNMGYKLDFDLKINSKKYIFVDLVARIRSNYMRTTYTLEQLDYNPGSTSFYFVKGKVDTSAMETSVIGGISISNEMFGSYTPVLAFGQARVTNKDYISKKSETKKEWIVSGGLDSKIDFSQNAKL